MRSYHGFARDLDPNPIEPLPDPQIIRKHSKKYFLPGGSHLVLVQTNVISMNPGIGLGESFIPAAVGVTMGLEISNWTVGGYPPPIPLLQRCFLKYQNEKC